MGLILLLLLIAGELGFVIVSFMKKSSKRTYLRNRFLLNLGELAVLGLLLLFGVVDLGIRFRVLFGVLGFRVFCSGMIFAFKRRKLREDKPLRTATAILRIVGNSVLLALALIPVFVFCDYDGLEVTGKYEVANTSEIFVDESRVEAFEDDGSKREVPVEFWYPKNAGNEKFPVIFFSHGAFGYRQSNYSTYTELASHGYVVCSMDHPYHSFYTTDTDGKTILVDRGFMQDVMNTDGTATEEEIFHMSQTWMKLRTDDMNFAVDTVIEKCKDGESGVYSLINCDKIGLMGHSMGGAASIALGRERDDIDAVIDIDGTMLSEEQSYDGTKYTFISEPYPTPFLSIDNESHHEQIVTLGETYVNAEVLAHAVDGTETYFVGSDHMNFTDLPLFSDILAKQLGTGSIDKVKCIKMMNQIILDYFNHYLKDEPEVKIKSYYE